MRVSPVADRIGFETVRLDARTVVKYNADRKSTLLGTLLDHANSHDGKVLLPFSGIISVKSLSRCGKMYIYTDHNGRCLRGTIREVGANYRRGMNDHDGFTVPSRLKFGAETRWAKLDDLGEFDFRPDDYVHYDYATGMARPLSEALDTSHMAIMYIYPQQ